MQIRWSKACEISSRQGWKLTFRRASLKGCKRLAPIGKKPPGRGSGINQANSPEGPPRYWGKWWTLNKQEPAGRLAHCSERIQERKSWSLRRQIHSRKWKKEREKWERENTCNYIRENVQGCSYNPRENYWSLSIPLRWVCGKGGEQGIVENSRKTTPHLQGLENRE